MPISGATTFQCGKNADQLELEVQPGFPWRENCVDLFHVFTLMSHWHTTVRPEIFQRLCNLDEGNILNEEPAEVALLRELRSAGVELIEWRAELYRRMHVPIMVMVSIGLTSPRIFDLNQLFQGSFIPGQW